MASAASLEMKLMHEEGPFRVLLADDEEPFRRTTARLLERHGLLCTEACCADEVLALLGEVPFDVLVADIKMPGNDRLDLIAQVSALEFAPTVILMTGYPSVETAAGSLEHGVFAYRIKPFDLDDLLLQVREAGRRTRLRRRIGRQEAEIQVQAQRLEALRVALARSGAPQLEQTAADYLSLLMVSLADTALEAAGLIDCLQSAAEPVRQLSRHPELDAYRAAVAESIRVLEQTKNSFKSKELATLRRQLQMLVDVTGSS
jgi:DNA-binding response OmpR family regulator